MKRQVLGQQFTSMKNQRAGQAQQGYQQMPQMQQAQAFNNNNLPGQMVSQAQGYSGQVPISGGCAGPVRPPCGFPPPTPFPPVPLYPPGFGFGFNNQFRDDFVDNVEFIDRIPGPMGPQGPQGPQGPEGRIINRSGLFNINAQTIAAGASGLPLTLGTILSNGVSLSGNQLVFSTAGTYMITLNASAQGTGGNSQLVFNSTALGSSPVYLFITGTEQETASSSFITQISANGTVSFTVSNSGASNANLLSGTVSAALIAPL